MKKIVVTLSAMLLASLSLAVSATQPLTLIYSGNLDGELEPCGCAAEGNFGGILRRATTLEALRSAEPKLVLLSAGGLITGGSPQYRVKNDYILSGFAQLNYDAIAIQWQDLIYGEAFLLNRGLPLVSSNIKDKGFVAEKRITRGGVQIAFFSWLDPDDSPHQDMQGEHGLTDHSTERLIAALKKAKAEQAITVVATTLPQQSVIELLPLELVDIVTTQAAYEVYGEPQLVEQTLFLEPGSRGMRLGKLKLNVADGRIKQWQHEVIEMPNTVADAASMKPWYDAYSAELKKDYEKRSAIQQAMSQGESPYAGAKACATCHESQYQVWKGSQHAQAFSDLEDVNKEFDGFCVGCHVVGYEKAGGFVDGLLTYHLAGVQCESCHGAAAAHVKSEGREKPANRQWKPEQMCQQCHVQKHSPSFDLERYWSKIKH